MPKESSGASCNSAGWQGMLKTQKQEDHQVQASQVYTILAGDMKGERGRFK